MKRRPRSDKLLAVLGEYSRILLVTHDNPDPDGIASCWALLRLVQEKLHKNVRAVAGGAIVRAENRRLVELLRPPLELVERVTADDETAIVMVDCSPAGMNHVLEQAMRAPVAVIDHHQPTGRRFRVRYRDIRPRFAATATIVSRYLRDQGVEPDTALATALVYAIRTDAIGKARFSRSDQHVVSWLHNWASVRLLADIENAPLTRHYYADLLLALENTLVYDRVGLCFLPQAAGSEIVGEVADLLIRCEQLDQVLCAAVVGHDVVVSVRTSADGGDAARLVRAVLSGLGNGGGHEHRAGGKLALAAQGKRISDELQTELRGRWLAVCHVRQQRGTRLVARREIARHLD